MQEQCSLITCEDPTALNAWYVVAAVCELPIGLERPARLLDAPLTLRRERGGTVQAWLGSSAEGLSLPCRQKFGYAWTSLGVPAQDIFDIPQYDEPHRRNMNAASVGVNVSGPRAIENFLDLAHFAFVHTNYLGVEPHTEIKPYQVNISEGGEEILATQCRAYQPVAALSAKQGYEVEYVYRVPHPYCALLYKAVATDPTRQDVIGLLLQPITEDRVVAHMLLSLLDDTNSDAALRGYQQLIFSQDKPILENQLPKRLPLNLRTEVSARADASSSTYRRWLNDHRVRYGTIPP
ncbi:MAG TPA: aromatic ring-hydroxylating dioxygenase subunit alpha [Steroidobacteraceae bacterium]|nr:aromatic ring-hydroxylating dioxygenase subunit alpha [Steroidobacteraceae bacterium]